MLNIRRNETVFCRDESYNYVALAEHEVSNDLLVIKSPEDVFGYMSWMKRKCSEYFCVIPLDGANHPLGYEIVTKGIEDQTPVRASFLFKCFLSKKKYASCVSFLMVHNHPSGNSDASEEDKVVTKRIIAASKVLEIRVLDHIIIGREFKGRSSYLSMARRYIDMFTEVTE